MFMGTGELERMCEWMWTHNYDKHVIPDFLIRYYSTIVRYDFLMISTIFRIPAIWQKVQFAVGITELATVRERQLDSVDDGDDELIALYVIP